MVRFHNTICIQRPIDEVFHFIAEFENVPKWNYFVQSVIKTSSGPVGIGTVFHQIRKTDAQDYYIKEYNINEKIVVESIQVAKQKFRREMTFHDEKLATTIVDKWSLEIGMFSLFDRFVTGRIKSAVNENLGKLKELLETGTVPLLSGKRLSL